MCSGSDGTGVYISRACAVRLAEYTRRRDLEAARVGAAVMELDAIKERACRAIAALREDEARYMAGVLSELGLDPDAARYTYDPDTLEIRRL